MADIPTAFALVEGMESQPTFFGQMSASGALKRGEETRAILQSRCRHPSRFVVITLNNNEQFHGCGRHGVLLLGAAGAA